MPRGMEFDLIETVTVAVKRAQLRREPVGIETKLNGLRLAQCRAKCGKLVFRPAGAFALDCVTKHNVAGIQVVRFKRGRLVLDLEHGLPSSFRGARRRANPKPRSRLRKCIWIPGLALPDPVSVGDQPLTIPKPVAFTGLRGCYE